MNAKIDAAVGNNAAISNPQPSHSPVIRTECHKKECRNAKAVGCMGRNEAITAATFPVDEMNKRLQIKLMAWPWTRENFFEKSYGQLVGQGN